ncbi:hypothetical protein GR160_15850 [Flavobacterium sp. Sd200]|uniref:nuclear transport factor 2 family protein n=1 Tax=Flavobacterium sp. Sd200 TaxID=2692211 RepID=UPI00136C1B1E|nr:nuclear transport factor 2 family protein [Flavobacterium sp. Sd200]MXN92703.1 hypothetical protein [Flavobacterium sp. Sd200]
MKKLLLLCSSLSLAATIYFNMPVTINTIEETATLNTFLNEWHEAAAKVDYQGYFDKIANDGHYMGTDAAENWDKAAFEVFSKPYFDKGKAWNFKTLERHIYFSKDGKTAWFDELLDTQMKICRGSGVLQKEGKEWKIKHYVLSMTVPNEVVKQVVPIKSQKEEVLIEKLRVK